MESHEYPTGRSGSDDRIERGRARDARALGAPTDHGAGAGAVLRCRIVLTSAAGQTNIEIAAALNVASARVFPDLSPRHRPHEFRRFLELIKQNVPAELAAHAVMDNVRTRTKAAIQCWVADWNANPRPFVWHKTADQIFYNLAGYLNVFPTQDI